MTSPRKFQPSSETVTSGHTHLGMVISNERGHEAYGPAGQYLATFESKARARRALFDLHQASEEVRP